MDVDPVKLTAVLEASWWLGFLAAFGLCVGSFLNAVIYRVPRNLSLRDPLWSFCPGCHARIHWYDNLPLISFVRLHGRCRHCRMPIALRYPIIEMLGAMIVLLIADAMFIAHTRGGFDLRAVGITWQMSDHWPMLVAHIVLFTCLLAMSAIDIEMYWVDVRFTTLATIAGFVLHAFWTPPAVRWQRPSELLGAAGIATTVVLVITILVLYLVLPDEPEPDEHAGDVADKQDAVHAVGPPAETSIVPDETRVEPPASREARPGSIAADWAELQPDTTVELAPDGIAVGTTEAPLVPPADAENAATATSPPETAPVQGPPARWPGQVGAILAGLSLLALMAGAFVQAAGLATVHPATMRWWPALLLMLGLIIATGARARESDVEIVEAIEAERTSARKMVGIELLCLLPAIAAGGLVLWFAARSDAFADWVKGAMHTAPLSDWRPLTGLGTAAAGFVIGGGIGWAVRIVATAVMGKEAFGTGDIHMMAAAGCVAGWPVVLIGFVLCCLLALFGWLVALPFKRTRAIPLGPWLSLAFLIVVLYYDPIIESRPVQNVIELFTHFPIAHR